MSRWHAATCVSPDVVLNGEVPLCNACGAVPDLDAIRLKQQQTTPLPSIPPNEASGQFNLYWPLSSLYSHSKTCQSSDGDDENEKRHSTDSFEPSPVYHRRLHDHEFRLLRLEGATSGTDLLHVHLETHDQERFPVYETVSYTWGGENNDNSRCRPVFIGPHWDVLLQTQNCWDMLKFLRPADGLLRLWVDAICINQKDDKEREAQVSKMVDIYQEAQRVVVYLGGTLIDSGSPHKYPLRRKFEHSIMQSNDSDRITRDGKLDVSKLLEKRYFSRLWVIQELVISRQVVFQVGDTEFWADGATIPRLKDHDWENTPAPWLVHMCRGTPPGIEIYDAMRKTWSSKASDPRDNIFGVLALLNDRGRELFRPDYSLSFIHVFIGLLAHSLLDQKRVEILCHALGHSAPDGQPSWIMDWNSPKWPAHCNFQDQAGLAFQSWKLRWPQHWVWTQEDDPAKRNVSNDASDPQKPTAAECTICQFSTGDNRRFQHSSVRRRRSFLSRRLEEERWDNGAAVDASTGSLTIKLTRICEFVAVPSKVHTDKGMIIFEVQGTAPTEAWMYLITDMALDQLVTPTKDHLFVLDQGDDKSFVLLILRKLDESPTFRLIGCCYDLYFRFIGSRYLTDLNLFLDDLRKRRRLDEILDLLPGCRLLEGLRHLQPNNTTERQRITHIRALLGGSDLFSLQAYCDCIHPRFQPVVNGKYVEITMQPANWHNLLNCGDILDFLELYAELRLEGEDDWTSSKRILYRPLASLDHKDPKPPGTYNRPLHLRVSQDKLHALMKDLSFSLARAGIRSRCRSDARFYMPPESIIGEEAGALTCPSWSQSILEGFTLDGRIYRVCIA